jgi:hypothetical protein
MTDSVMGGFSLGGRRAVVNDQCVNAISKYSYPSVIIPLILFDLLVKLPLGN